MKKQNWRQMVRTFVVGSTALLMTLGSALAGEIDTIKAHIKEKGAKWEAGDTSLMQLAEHERKKRVGTLKPSLTSVPDQSQTSSTYLAAPSGSYDWRNIGGVSYVTPVRDQGSCGSCWAFAATAALESYLLIKGPPIIGLDTAEQTLVSCSGAGSCSGGYIDRASSFIRDTGLPGEGCFPYSATNAACTSGCLNWQSTTSKTSNWHWVATTAPTVTAIKDALYTYGPLVTTMDVYADFYSYRSGVYQYVTGTYQGGHAILLTGYVDDAAYPGGGYFIVKNSWGTGWGIQGYFNIAYAELSSLTQFGDYTIAYDNAVPPPPTPSCTFSLSPSSKTFPATGGSGSFTVTAGSNCGWTAQTGVSWITITAGQSGTGNGTVSFIVSPTTGTRNGTITIKNENATVVATFNVKQQTRKR